MEIPVTKAKTAACNVPLAWTRSYPLCLSVLRKSDPLQPWTCLNCGWNTRECANSSDFRSGVSPIPSFLRIPGLFTWHWGLW
jgi:hypothetical protein